LHGSTEGDPGERLRLLVRWQRAGDHGELCATRWVRAEKVEGAGMNGPHWQKAGCRWERYQADQSYENLTNWLKYRAYCRILSDEMCQWFDLAIRGKA